MKQTIRPAKELASTRNGSPTGQRAAKSRATGPRVPDASREAKRVAASVLDVLAGASSPTTAAAALDVSLPRYYLLEQRAIEGLVTACEPRSGGRALSPHRELDVLRKQLDRLERECMRYQTLLRIAQRTIGLVPPADSTAKNKGAAKAKRTRRPTARALVAARTLRADEPDAAASIQEAAPSDHERNSQNNQGEPTPCTL
jgi:hypothetical protein